MKYDDAVREGRRLVALLDATQFELGDLALAVAPMGGDHARNGADDKVERFAADIGKAAATLHVYRQVAAAWPEVTRVTSASWTAHRDLMGRADRHDFLAALAADHERVTTDVVREALGGAPKHYPKPGVEEARRLMRDPEIAREVIQDPVADRTINAVQHTAWKETEKQVRDEVNEKMGGAVDRRDILTVIGRMNNCRLQVNLSLREARELPLTDRDWERLAEDAEHLRASVEWIISFAQAKGQDIGDEAAAFLNGAEE